MKVYRIIEYEIPDDYSPQQIDQLNRTLELSIKGQFCVPGGLTITATELAVDMPLSDAPDYMFYCLDEVRTSAWTPPHAALRATSRGDATT